MSWEDFERLVGEYYRCSGFQVTREGGNGPDGGMDLVLRKDGETHLVQCKQWKAYKGFEVRCVRARACNLVCETPALEGWPATG